VIEPSRVTRFEALVADYYEALEQGQTTPDLGKLIVIHPDLEKELRAFLDDVQVVQARLAPLGELVGACPPPELPRSVDAYVLGARLGSGGMGVVVRAHDRVLRRDVAIKIMQASPRDRPDLEQRFVAEAQILGQIEHPYIVPLNQLGRLPDGRPFLAMKLIQGRTLADLLRHRPMEARQLTAFYDRLVEIFGFVCQAMAYAHSRGVLHRDLKPANVMVGAHGEVQVMDWGLAKVRSSTPAEAPADNVNTLREESDDWTSQTGDVLGTYAYMAPEQAAGKVAELDERCDVFGLGAILCEILTGRPPYFAPDLAMRKRLATEGGLDDALDRLERCPADAELKALARQCLGKAPGARPANAAAVAVALEQYQTQRREQARQRELELAATKARMKSAAIRRWLAYGLAVTALLMAFASIVAGWFYLQYRDRQAALKVQQAELKERQADLKEKQTELKRLETETAWGVDTALKDAQNRQEAMQTAAGDDLDRLAEERIALARKAEEMARRGNASKEVYQKAKGALADAEMELAALAKDRRLMARLLELLFIADTWEYLRKPDKGLVLAVKPIGSDQQFAAAFGDWGLEPDRMPIAEAAAGIRARPKAIATELIAGLDAWAYHRRLQKLDTAARLLELADVADASDARCRELRKVLGAAVLDSERLREMAKEVKPASESTLTLVMLARALWEIGERETPSALMREALAVRPGDVVLRAQLASWCVVRGVQTIYGSLVHSAATPETLVSAEAVAHFSEAVANCEALRAKRPESRLLWAMALLHTPRYKEGLKIMQEIQKDRKDDPMVNLNVALALLVKGNDVAAAAEFAKKAETALDPSNKDIIYHILMVQAMKARDAKDWKTAEELFRRVHSSTKDRIIMATAYLGQGEALVGLGRHVEAIKAYGEASRINHALPSGHAFLALQSERVKQLDAAHKILMRGLEEDGENAALIVFAIEFFRRHGKSEEMARFKEALPRIKFPADAHSLFKVGSDLHAIKEFALADKAFRTLIQSNPDRFAGTTNLDTILLQSHFALSEALRAQGKEEEAKEWYKKGLKLKEAKSP
jgi:serine/threonine-protein kinase